MVKKANGMSEHAYAIAVKFFSLAGRLNGPQTDGWWQYNKAGGHSAAATLVFIMPLVSLRG
jgi:hypothetical protein